MNDTYSFQNKKTNGIKTALILISIGIVCFVSGFISSDILNNNRNMQIEQSDEIMSEPQAHDKQVTAVSLRVSPATQFVFITDYTLCNKTMSEIIAAPDNVIGLEAKQVAAMYPDWEINTFSINRVIFYRSLEAYPPGTYKLTLSEVGGETMLSLFKCDSEGKFTLAEVFSTPVELYNDEEKQKLSDGILIFSEEALTLTLQNYAE